MGEADDVGGGFATVDATETTDADETMAGFGAMKVLFALAYHESYGPPAGAAPNGSGDSELQWSGETGTNDWPSSTQVVAANDDGSEDVAALVVGADRMSSDADMGGKGVPQGVGRSMASSTSSSSKNPISSKIPFSSRSLMLDIVIVDNKAGSSRDETGPNDGIIERIVSDMLLLGFLSLRWHSRSLIVGVFSCFCLL
jgi:hypothetical protein